MQTCGNTTIKSKCTFVIKTTGKNFVSQKVYCNSQESEYTPQELLLELATEFLSPPVLMHGGLIYMHCFLSVWTRKKFISQKVL